LKSGLTLQADYFIFASGNSDLIRNILKEEYVDLSDVLLTNKAVVYPLEYTDKRNQFHPYTLAKTMKYGWRWITPTYSRIGTGYVFSDRHVSVDQAVDEFLNDIGDKTLSPRVVEFCPRYNKKTFKKNYCTLGMLNGFLEPLDAPGLSMTGDVLIKLEKYLEYDYGGDDYLIMQLDHMNGYIKDMYQFWASFILAQYKTCHRNDTKFWIDHKNVKYDFYDNIIENLNNYMLFNSSMMMFYHTLAGKDYQWNRGMHLAKFDDSSLKPAEHHLDFIEEVHKYRRG
jgi:tryptophan halogenase